jgi:peptidyl-prolyl cis-trans isomerase-like 3
MFIIHSRLQFNARGVVAMANTGPDTNKSQFFITYAKQAHLDSKYTIFGKVIDGQDSTLDAMERVPVNNKNRPLSDIKLTHVRALLFLPCFPSLRVIIPSIPSLYLFDR